MKKTTDSFHPPPQLSGAIILAHSPSARLATSTSAGRMHAMSQNSP
jgi:hypothetical protein